MARSPGSTSRDRRRERGALLLALVVEIAIGMILFGVAAQKWSDVRQREKEAEMFARAREIQLALIRYQRDRGTLPVEFKQLIEPGSRGQYFIRKLYKDPLAKDGKWGLLRQGPNGQVFDPYKQETPESDLIGTTQTTPVTSPTEGVSGLSTSDPGEVAGGLPIVGVKTLCTEPPFRYHNDHNEYSEMLFTIFDFMGNRQGQPGQPTGITPGGAPGGNPPSPQPRPPGG